MARIPPSPLSRAKLILVGPGESYSIEELANEIYSSFRSYKKDRCAVFIDYDQIKPFVRALPLDEEFLDAELNFHWTGPPKTLKRKWKRILVGDYVDWFCWYMRWQRFNAFHVLVLVKPITYMLSAGSRGYLDGFLSRLMNKQAAHRIIIVEEQRFESAITKWLDGVSRIESPDLASKFGRQELGQAILSTLYGTSIPRLKLSPAIGRTFSSKLNPDWESILHRTENGWLIERRHHRFRSLSEDGMKLVQSIEQVVFNKDKNAPESDELFQQERKLQHVKIDTRWLEEEIANLVEKDGWFTIPSLYDYVTTHIQEMTKSSAAPPNMLDPYCPDSRSPRPLLLPSAPILRNLAERMVRETRLEKSTWFREVGRPAFAYHLPRRLPFSKDDRCGQCAFYISQRRRCRLWWLLNQSFGSGDPRWSKEGATQLSSFEIYKMKNSWRISPHASACSKFVDKKRDYTRKDIPANCDICGHELPKSKTTVACRNCRTRYLRIKKRVRVLTSYEHEFERIYREIGGTNPASDLQQLQLQRRGSTFEILEEIEYEQHRQKPQPKTVMLFPEDRMTVKDGKLFLFRRRSVESVPLSGTVIVDHDVIDEEQRMALENSGATVRLIPKSIESSATAKVAATSHDIGEAVERTIREHPEFVRKLVLAMLKSAVNATGRIGTVAGLTENQIEGFTKIQTTLIGRLEHVLPKRFLVYEALTMKQYWNCYDLALKRAFEWTGHRKKSRFVREFITNPIGRAKGYTAVDAAINYLHQRRLFKSRSINLELGLKRNPGEGFLHRRRWNSDGLGLLLDLIDPFKFADREELLKAILDYRLNWRDFYTAIDRRGVRFYYPKPEAINALEVVGEEADRMQVSYGGATVTLIEAYRSVVKELIQSLQVDVSSFEPFIY